MILEVAGLDQLLHPAVGSEGHIQFVGRYWLCRVDRVWWKRCANSASRAASACDCCRRRWRGTCRRSRPWWSCSHVLAAIRRVLRRLRGCGFGQDRDGSLAQRVAGLELVSVRQLEIQLVGGNLHGLTAGARLLGLRILPHTGVLDHVKTRRLVLVLEVDNESVGGTVSHAGAVGVELGSAREDSLLDRVLGAHVQIAAGADDVDDGDAAHLNMHVALRQLHVAPCCPARTAASPWSAVRVRSGCSIWAFSSIAWRGTF